MKNEYLINLSNINNLRQFSTDILYKVESEVDAIYDKQIIDAKSLMGLVSLSTHDIRVVIHSNNEKELKNFEQICKKYEVG